MGPSVDASLLLAEGFLIVHLLACLSVALQVARTPSRSLDKLLVLKISNTRIEASK